jgi:hypothetical protein
MAFPLAEDPASSTLSRDLSVELGRSFHLHRNLTQSQIPIRYLWSPPIHFYDVFHIPVLILDMSRRWFPHSHRLSTLQQFYRRSHLITSTHILPLLYPSPPDPPIRPIRMDPGQNKQPTHDRVAEDRKQRNIGPVVLPDGWPICAEMHLVDSVGSVKGGDDETGGEEYEHEEGGVAGPAEVEVRFGGGRAVEADCVSHFLVE